LPSIIIGDLDSLTQEDRDVLDAKGVEFRQHPRNKDQTDLELALDYAIQAGHREILVVGALGGRLDQTLGNLSLLGQPRFSTYNIRLTDGVEEVLFTRDHCVIDGAPGDIVSLIPWGAETTGITSEGLRWSLRDEVLFPDRTRGISNELVDKTASVTVGTGLLLVVHRFIK
jgi:thiamine pyrophosphokinase